MNIMIGIFMTVLGAIGSISTLLNIANDPYYTYTAPFSKHETTMMTLFFISFILAFKYLSSALSIISSKFSILTPCFLNSVICVEIKSIFSSDFPKKFRFDFYLRYCAVVTKSF